MSGLADRLPRRRAAARPLHIPAHPSLASRLIGLGTIFGKSLRDARRALLLTGGGTALFAIFVGAQVAQQYGTIADRQQLAAQMGSLPPLFRGLLGEPIAIDTLGGFLSWRLLNFMPVMLGVWSIVALSSTLAREARLGSLEFLASTGIPRARIALEKLAGHLVAVALAMVIAALGLWLATEVFATVEGDARSLADALSHALWLGLSIVFPGAVAFAVAPLIGRAGAAGVGVLVLAGSYIVHGYAETLPIFESVDALSYFGWAAGHRPLAGVSDWGSLGLIAAIETVLFAIGVGLFVRRDLGHSASLGIRLPRLRIGLREPFGRSFADRLGASIAWALGIGAYGYVIAISAEAFADSLSAIPQIGDMIARFYPGVDFRTAEGVLQLAFFGFGILLIGVAAATLVAGWASDESDGRLELVLSTPVTRAAWALRSALGVMAALALTGVVMGLLVGGGSASQGDDFVRPFAGALVAALYGAALAGIGLAVGGLVRPGLAAPVTGMLAGGFYVLQTLGPAIGLPDALVDLSLSRHLGQPMVGTFDGLGIAASLVLAIGGVTLAALGYGRRDIER